LQKIQGFCVAKMQGSVEKIQGSLQKKMQGCCVATYPDVCGGMTHSDGGGGTTHLNALLKTWGSFEKIQGSFENLQGFLWRATGRRAET